ncbi:hypothetical protein ACFL4F_02725 [Candidatus Margulisiibacteriota bacterium]
MSGGEGYSVPQGSTPDSITGAALRVAVAGCTEIDAVLADISSDNSLNDSVFFNDANSNQIQDAGEATIKDAGWINDQYGINVNGGLDTSSAAGAMVVDDLMQKISTKVQVAAQLLATSNKMGQMVQNLINQR